MSSAPSPISKNALVTAVKQRHSNWCWAACCEMLATYHGFKGCNQDGYVTMVLDMPKGAEIENTSIYNSQAAPQELVSALRKVLPTAKYKMHTGLNPEKRFEHEAMINFFDESRIMIFGSSNHARVLSGYRTTGSKQELIAVDPAVGAFVALEWSVFDGCDWIIYVPKMAAKTPG